MLTEQEVLAHINNKKDLKPSSSRLVGKIRLLESALSEKDLGLKDAQRQARIIENDILRLRGAISVLIELIAEEEGLISDSPKEIQ